MRRITAPFTAEEVESLNAYQAKGMFHPFTCGSGHRTDRNHKAVRQTLGDRDDGLLIATENGWICPACSYRQNWAYQFMSDPANLRPSGAGSLPAVHSPHD